MGAVLGTRLALLPPAADELACSPLGTGSGSGVAAGWVAAGWVAAGVVATCLTWNGHGM